ncbi:TFIIB-type zinc finger domain-containing protein [Poseidonocella sp. HB161398]|uniref:TFIIB-type zinc finger domain-containing protein n=1 Tax=Poseidonocella sp. HB161398 TaxID=2320855 RepID=UPI00110863A7|nr:TFIIB-type zinc finger domain-containing protein [Poseidonocella sp. HB161398]
MEESHRFPCEACGAAMRYDPRQGALVCDHCGHVAEVDDRNGPWGAPNAIRELDFRDALRNQLDAADLEETQVFRCTSCGAQVEFQPGIHADRCPFCATPIVGETSSSRHIKPRGLVPFAITEAEAHDAMARWLGRLWFAPSGLAEFARKGRKMEGIYLPYWTFDAQTRSDYTGQRGEVYFQTRRRGDGSVEQVAKVRWYPARGRVARFFDDVLVAGSRSLPGEMMSGLPPWDLSRLEPYKPEYLAGLRAEAYGLELDEAFHQARAHMDRVIARDVRFDIGGDRQRIQRIETEVDSVTFKHVLLPVWVGVYRFRGQAYQLLVNAQSGRVQGARPWSAWKIAVAVAAGTLLAAGIGYLFALNQGL